MRDFTESRKAMDAAVERLAQSQQHYGTAGHAVWPTSLYRRNDDGTFSPVEGNPTWSMKMTEPTGSKPSSKPADPTSVAGERATAATMAYRMAYAPLRSAQHAFQIIARGSPHISAVQELAREEAARLNDAMEALATNAPDAAKRERGE